MRVKFHLITNLITLSLTVFLLICIVSAWYVSNKEVSAGGITGSTLVEEEQDSLIKGVEYYYIESIEGNTYTIGAAIEGVSSNFQLKPYNALSNEPHQILLKIDLNQANLVINANIKDDQVDNALKTTVDGVTKYIYAGSVDSSNQPIKAISSTNNQLSSIISFYYVTDVINNQFTVTEEEEISFVQKTGDNFDNYLNSSITLCDDTQEFDTEKSVYIMFDYCEEAIEQIYSINLGSDALNPSKPEDATDDSWMNIHYKCDFTISLSKKNGGEK